MLSAKDLLTSYQHADQQRLPPRALAFGLAAAREYHGVDWGSLAVRSAGTDRGSYPVGLFLFGKHQGGSHHGTRTKRARQGIAFLVKLSEQLLIPFCLLGLVFTTAFEIYLLGVTRATADKYSRTTRNRICLNDYHHIRPTRLRQYRLRSQGQQARCE
jgi:hypothetical protein